MVVKLVGCVHTYHFTVDGLQFDDGLDDKCMFLKIVIIIIVIIILEFVLCTLYEATMERGIIL